MLLIKNGILVTMTDDNVYIGDILIKDRKIAKICPQIDPLEVSGGKIIDASGCYVLPGLIDAHCHIGISEERRGADCDDCNETTNPLTPHMKALDAINPMDSAFEDAVRAGITSVMVGPGSTNVVGGHFLFMKTYGSRNIKDLVLLEPAAMKIALGENPKSTYGEQNLMPVSRMGIASMLREELFKARKYISNKQNAIKVKNEYEDDFRLESWIPVFMKKIPLKAHVHRVDDILTAIRIANEFNLNLTLDHCSEGHLICNEIKASGFPTIVGPGFASRNKIEVKYSAFKTAGILSKAGVLIAITTDHPVTLIQTLPICAGFAVKAGLTMAEGLRAITINAAKICNVDQYVGSLEVGKDADIAIFNGNPMETFTNCLYTIINGTIVFDIQNDIRR